MSRTHPDGTYNWQNQHDWGTPAQQQAERDAPDARKVTTVRRWAVVPAWQSRTAAIRYPHLIRRSHADGVKARKDATYPPDAPHRIIRLDVTITEDAGTTGAAGRDGGENTP